MRIHFITPALLCLIWLSTSLVQAQVQTLFATNTFWFFKRGTNEASTPTTNWRQISWDDSTWESGRTPFHYGEGLSTGTTLSNMRSNYSCVFLRKHFNITDISRVGALTLNATSDDGFIAWINGVEIARYNVAPGEPNFRSVASASAPDPAAPIAHLLPDPRSFLVQGENVLSVQAFNQNISSSSDFHFNASLTAAQPDLTAPFISQFFPPAGRIPILNQISVTFNEPVLGVDASDLWINGTPAVSVEGSGSTYTFSFNPVPFGPAFVTWYSAHGITDTSFNTNIFDSAAASALWQYDVLDDRPPVVTTINPPANATVRQLSQIEIRFDEPVLGIEASALLINGSPAASVRAATPATYLFEFPRTTNSQVTVSWSGNHNISDTQTPPNRFVANSWSYSISADAGSGDVVINEFLTSNISATGLVDEDRELEGWIELYNRGSTTVNLSGWSLTDDPDVPDQWIFPNVSISPRQYLIVFTSGKDRRATTAGARLHTNFKLSPEGEYLALFNAESPRSAISEIRPGYPSQRNDFSYGRDTAGDWRFFRPATPGAANGQSTISGVVDEPHFSVERGFFNQPFDLTLASTTPGATIRYTLNGSVPSETNGFLYLTPIPIRTSTVLRAAAFLSNSLPSRTVTHTYLVGLAAARLSLPAVSIVTASNNLRGPTGIMEINPQNTTKRGIAWERPSSVEWIRPEDNGGFQIDCGLRVQGGDYIRGRYNPNTTTPPEGKFSFRLYFRGDYGPGKLRFPLFGDSPVQEFDRIVLRAGMNDPTNPFIVDELMRRLAIETGQVSARGTFVHLFLNGVYKGYYNPTEGYEEDFFQSWHGGGRAWDLVTQAGGLNAGDRNAFNTLNNLITRSNIQLAPMYAAAERQLDMTNFVDYLLVNIYGGTGDWPHNNWRAARERVNGARYRFYIWDAEWALGNLGRAVTLNTLTAELANGSEIANFYQRLRLNPEFRLLFADRIQKHFFNNGALTDARITNHFNIMRNELRLAIPSLQTTILSSWVPRRRTNIFNHLRTAGLIASTNAPGFNQHGGRIAPGFNLTLTNLEGTIYYTTDGSDPRTPVTGTVNSTAVRYDRSPIQLTRDTLIKARSLAGTNWSAVTEAGFILGRLGSPIRITEILFNPGGGDPYEYVELLNTSETPFNLGHYSFDGISFTFPENTILPAGARLLLASGIDPRSFTNRYPGARIGGTFSGTLSNNGERLALKDPSGATVVSVEYRKDAGWPADAALRGHSLEIINPEGDPDDPSNWRASLVAGGTPGSDSNPPAAPSVQINEILADNLRTVTNGGSSPDFIELRNVSTQTVNLSGWNLSDTGVPSAFKFPQGTSLAPGDHLLVFCDTATNQPGFHTGFALDRSGESVTLFDASSNRVDAVSFGPQITDRSLSRFSGDWALGIPTPGGTNQAAPLAPSSDILINEWLANPAPGEDDWVELYNRNPNLPAALNGCYISTSNSLHRITSHSFIEAGGFIKLIADERPGAAHLDFKIPAAGGTLTFFDPTGAEINKTSYGPQRQGFSSGRIPNGSSTLATFANSGSGGSANYIPNYTGARLNEVSAAPAPTPVDPWGANLDWIELHNPGNTTFDLSGMTMSTGRQSDSSWVIPPGTRIAANGFLVIWMSREHAASLSSQPPLNSGISLSSDGDSLLLSNAAGQLVDSLEFGFQVSGQPIGLIDGSWKLLTRGTPGAANSTATTLGSVSSLKINEWMASPSDGPDWFEIFNEDSRPVELTSLFLTDDPSISGATNSVVGPNSFIGPRGFVRVVADGQLDQGPNHVNFSLNELGETLRIYSPTLALLDDIDFAVQSPGISEGRLPDGAATWSRFPNGPTPALSNATPLAGPSLEKIQIRGSTLTFTFVASAGSAYVVESTPSLGQPAWTANSNVPAAAQREVTVSIDLKSDDHRFFRLRLAP